MNDTTQHINSAFHPYGVDRSSTNLPGWGEGGAVTSVGWQITLCDPIDRWRPVVLRWISRRTIRSFTFFTFNYIKISAQSTHSCDVWLVTCHYYSFLRYCFTARYAVGLSVRLTRLQPEQGIWRSSLAVPGTVDFLVDVCFCSVL